MSMFPRHRHVNAVARPADTPVFVLGLFKMDFFLSGIALSWDGALQNQQRVRAAARLGGGSPFSSEQPFIAVAE